MVFRVLISPTTIWRIALRRSGMPGAVRVRPASSFSTARRAGSRLAGSHVNETQNKPELPGFHAEASMEWTNP